MANGKLGNGSTTANANTTFYTAPSNIKFATITVNCCNRTGAEVPVRIAVSTSDTPSLADYYDYDFKVPANGSLERSCIPVSPGEKVVVYATSSEISVRVSGLEQV